MTGPFPRALAAALLLAGGLTAFAPGPAAAQACLSPQEMRASVQRGDAVMFSRFRRQIEAATGGEVQGLPRLCGSGGNLVYMVNVIGQGGQIKRITVDARSGSILGQGY